MMQTRCPSNIPAQTTRGRPYKSSTDAQAQARRKQIREAQRSYRSRQQSHVASLKARVAQLEDVVSQLGQIVNTFHEQVIRQSGTSGSQSGLTQSVSLLKEVTDEYLKRAEICAAARDSEFEGRVAKVLPLPEPSSSFDGRSCESSVDDSLLSLVQNSPRTSGKSRSDLWRVFFSPINSILPPIQDASPTIPYPLHDTSIEVIHYATTPFTQRLFRASAENGYGYLINASVSDAQMWHEFGLQLEYQPREDIIRYFKRSLQMNPCNPIKDHRVPFISLGGAGTHFQTTCAGCASVPQLQETPNLLLFQETNGVRVVPSEEQWFDVRDVEGYLVENGIKYGCHNSALYTAGRDASSGLSGQLAPRNMVPVLNESALIQVLSRICISLGCSAGFRRHDVETHIWQNVTWELD